MPSSYRSLLVAIEKAIFIQVTIGGHKEIPSSFRSLLVVIENVIFIQVTIVSHRECHLHIGHYWWS